jgi:hypothetical protein
MNPVFEPASTFLIPHFGIAAIYGGLNQIYFTYGTGIDLGLVKVMYTSYAEEMGAVTGLDAERRHLLYVTVKLDP